MERPLTFEAPGPGAWMLDTTHHGRRPITRAQRRIADESFVVGMGRVLARYGLPLTGFDTGYVHGCQYVRPRAVGEPDDPRGDPPRPVLWLLARLHPELRRRNRVAKAAWQERRWRADVDDWFGSLRASVVAGNREFQAVDVERLDDTELLAHVTVLGEHCLSTATRAFALHGGDMIPAGDYIAHCADWGIDPAAACAALAGASPASRAVADLLAPVDDALRSLEHEPTSVEEIRSLGPAVARAVDTWLDDHGWRLLFSDDLDTPTLAERPDLQLRALVGSGASPTTSVDVGELRARVPDDQRSLFDELLEEARYGLRLRDDNVGVAWNWPCGLLRRGLLEVGARLVERGALRSAEHVLEVEPAELGPLLTSGSGPTADEVAERWEWRFTVEAAIPPDTLGPPSEPPPADVFPAPLARATRSILAMIGAMEGGGAGDERGDERVGVTNGQLLGTGIGTAVHVGRARVVDDPAEALATTEPGDVIVTSITGPAWNSLLPIVGALVVEEGGPLSHAAIVARELGIAAVIGVTGATAAIPDGATVEVDPAEGVVRLR